VQSVRGMHRYIREVQGGEFGAAVRTANPINNRAASRCAAIAAGHTSIDGRIASNNLRTSATSSGLRRFGGVLRCKARN